MDINQKNELESELEGSISHRSVSPLGLPKSPRLEETTLASPSHVATSRPDTIPDERNPSGKTMLDRANRVRDNVKAQLPNYPPGRGNHPLNYLYYLKHYCYKQVRVQTTPTIVLKYASFEAFLRCPSFETVRRRTQEIQHEEKERIWEQIAVKFGWANGTDIEWREREEVKKEFNKLARASDLLPTKRTLDKRKRNQNVHVEYFSDKQMALGDWD